MSDMEIPWWAVAVTVVGSVVFVLVVMASGDPAEDSVFEDRFLEDLESGLSDRYGPVDCRPLKWSHRFECMYANNQSQRFELAFVPVERDRLDVPVVSVRQRTG